MSGTEAQLAFVAEFILFVACLAGVAVCALRSTLLVEGRTLRVVTTVAFLAVGATAFVRGSLIESDPTAAVVLVPRLAGLAALGFITFRSTLGPVARGAAQVAIVALAAAEVTSLVVDDPAGGPDVVRAVGAAVLVGTLVMAGRRSIPARVAASGAGSVLLVVLAVSVTLSTVVIDNVEDELRRRTATRAESERVVLTEATDAALVTASSAGAIFDQQEPRDDARISQQLQILAERFLAVEGALAFVGADERVVAGVGIDDPAVLGQLAFLDPVQDALAQRGGFNAPAVLDRGLVGVAAAPVSWATDDGAVFAGAVVATRPLDDTFLRRSAAVDPDVTLAVVGRDGVLARSSEETSDATLVDLASDVLAEPVAATRAVDGRFLAATPLVVGGDTIAVLVASADGDLVVDTRKSLFRTLFLVALVATTLAIALAAAVGSRIGRGLRQLTTAAEAIETGRLDVRTGVSQPDELGVLGAAFDRMAVALGTMTDDLRDAAVDEARLRGRLQAVVGGMGEALVAVDGDGLVTEYNPAAAQLFGLPARRVLGKPADRLPFRILSGDDLIGRLGDPEAGAWTTEAVVRDEIPTVVSAAPLRGAAGERAGAVLVVRDVRREREVERMKSEFLSNISHEMKTPLTPIKGYANMLASRKLPAARTQAFAGEIAAAARQLERVITQLVDFSSMAAGRLEPRPETVAAKDVLDELIARWEDRVDGTHELRRRVRRGTPALQVDRRLLDLSLDELVDNAIKYSPDGGRITIEASPDGPRRVLVSVSDRGVGVQPDQMAAIFDEFAQADGSSTREFGGLGLGLPLVRHVARAHGGDLDCTSKPGRGSTFTLVLPAAKKGRR